MEARIQAGEAKGENPKTEEKRFLRPAEAADASFLLALRNDPLVRKWSFHHDHKRWLAKVLADDNRHLYILMAGNTPAGQVRIDQNEANEAKISYSLLASFRGQGLGNVIIALLIEEVEQNLPEIRALTAEVIPGNTASCRVFEKIDTERKDGKILWNGWLSRRGGHGPDGRPRLPDRKVHRLVLHGEEEKRGIE